MSEEFEKSLKEFESEHLTNPSGLVRKIGIYFYAVRQPEIDALKLKTESDKREWQTVVAAFDSELKRVRAENERLRKDAHGHVEFIKAKAHHLPIEDQHVLAVMLDAAMKEEK